MAGVLEARAVITAEDKTGKAFDSVKARIAGLTKQIEAMDRAMGAVGAVAKSVEGFKIPTGADAELSKMVGTIERVDRAMLDVNRSAVTMKGNVGKTSAEVVQLSSKIMDAGSKLKAIGDFKVSARGVKEASLAMQKAEQDARSLAAKIDGVPNPARSMMAAHAGALAEVREVGKALERQVATAAAARTALAEMGVPLNALRTEEERLKSSLMGTNDALLRQIELEKRSAAATEKAAAALAPVRGTGAAPPRRPVVPPRGTRTTRGRRRTAAAATASRTTPSPRRRWPSRPTRSSAWSSEAWHEGAELQHERTQLTNAGRTPEEMREIEAAGRSTISALPTANFTETMKVIAETTSAFGSVHHAIDNLPFMMKTMEVLKSAGGDKIQGDAGAVGRDFAKTFEERMTKPEEFQNEARMMIPAMVASGGVFNPEQLYGFAQQAKSALPNYDMRFLSKIVPSHRDRHGRAEGRHRGQRLQQHHHGQGERQEAGRGVGEVRAPGQHEGAQEGRQRRLVDRGRREGHEPRAAGPAQVGRDGGAARHDRQGRQGRRPAGAGERTRDDVPKPKRQHVRQRDDAGGQPVPPAQGRSPLQQDRRPRRAVQERPRRVQRGCRSPRRVAEDAGRRHHGAHDARRRHRSVGAGGRAQPTQRRRLPAPDHRRGGRRGPRLERARRRGEDRRHAVQRLRPDRLGRGADRLGRGPRPLPPARLGVGGPGGKFPGGVPTPPVVPVPPEVPGALAIPGAIELGAAGFMFAGGIIGAEVIKKQMEAQEPGKGGLWAPVTAESEGRDREDVEGLKAERAELQAKIDRQKALQKLPGEEMPGTYADRERIAQLDAAITRKEASLNDVEAAQSHEARVGRAMMAMPRPEEFGPDMPDGLLYRDREAERGRAFAAMRAPEEFGPNMPAAGPGLPGEDAARLRYAETDLARSRELAGMSPLMGPRAFAESRTKDDLTPLSRAPTASAMPSGGIPVHIVGSSVERMPTGPLGPGLHRDFTLGNNSGGFGSPGMGSSDHFDPGPRRGAAALAETIDAHPVAPHVDDSELVALEGKLSEVGQRAQAVGATPISIKADASSIEAMIGLLSRAIALKAQLGGMPAGGAGGTSGSVGTSYAATAPAGRQGGPR